MPRPLEFDVGQPRLVNVAVLLLLAKIAQPSLPAAFRSSPEDLSDLEQAFAAPSSKRVRRERPVTSHQSESSVGGRRVTAAKIAPPASFRGGGTGDVVVAAASASASDSASGSGGGGGGGSSSVSSSRRSSTAGGGGVNAGGTASIARLRRQTVPSGANSSGVDKISTGGGGSGAAVVAATAVWNTTTLSVDATTVAQPELIFHNDRSPHPMTPNGASMETGELGFHLDFVDS